MSVFNMKFLTAWFQKVYFLVEAITDCFGAAWNTAVHSGRASADNIFRTGR